MMIYFIVYPHIERVVLFHKVVPEMEFTQEEYPLLYSWIRRMQEVPAVRKTMHPDEQHVEFLKNYAVGKKECDIGL